MMASMVREQAEPDLDIRPDKLREYTVYLRDTKATVIGDRLEESRFSAPEIKGAKAVDIYRGSELVGRFPSAFGWQMGDPLDLGKSKDDQLFLWRATGENTGPVPKTDTVTEVAPEQTPAPEPKNEEPVPVEVTYWRVSNPATNRYLKADLTEQDSFTWTDNPGEVLLLSRRSDAEKLADLLSAGRQGSYWVGSVTIKRRIQPAQIRRTFHLIRRDPSKDVVGGHSLYWAIVPLPGREEELAWGWVTGIEDAIQFARFEDAETVRCATCKPEDEVLAWGALQDDASPSTDKPVRKQLPGFVFSGLADAAYRSWADEGTLLTSSLASLLVPKVGQQIEETWEREEGDLSALVQWMAHYALVRFRNDRYRASNLPFFLRWARESAAVNGYRETAERLSIVFGQHWLGYSSVQWIGEAAEAMLLVLCEDWLIAREKGHGFPDPHFIAIMREEGDGGGVD